MSTEELPPLTEKARALLAEERARPPLDEARADALWSRIAASVGPVGGGGPEGDGGGRGVGEARSSGGDARSGAAAGAARAGARTVGSFVATFAVGAVVGAAGYATIAAPRAPASVAERDASLGAVPVASAPAVVPPAEAAASARALATTASALHEAGASPASSSRRGAIGDQALAAERALIDRGRMALARGDGHGALAAADEHRARFAAGQLEEEREALAIRSLVGLDRRDEARARLAAFAQRHPKSLFLAPLRAIASE